LQYIRNGLILLALGASPVLLGQGGGRRGVPPTAAPATPAAPTTTSATPTGRGGGATASTGNEFYNFDATASQIRPVANPDAPPVEAHQKITANGQPLAYTTRAGFLPLLNATTGAPEAHIFYTSYSKDGVTDLRSRPVMFFFGGAPGVSAAWQEFGGLGPKRMKPEGGWADNAETVLTQADLVFVNPVGTGFSYPSAPSRGPIFWSTAGDTASLAEFVRSYLNRTSREYSPVFLAGEDQATGRVAGLAQYLAEHLIPVKGVVLLSVTPSPDALAGDFQYITLLPSLVLSSWHHKKLSPELNAMSAEQIAGQARQLASREYLHSLYKGDRMTAEERAKVVADLSRLTGLSKSFIINNDLRVTVERYNAELMREQRRGLSVSDARVSGYVPLPAGGRGGGGRGFGAPQPPVDFNMSAVAGPFATAYNDYLRHELNFTARKDEIFYLTTGGVGTFTSTGNDSTSLTAAFARNPNLRLFVAVNFFDLGLPFYAAEYTLAHLDVAPEVRSHNITVSLQEAGSMAYLDSKALPKLERDLAGFIARAEMK